MPPKDEEGRYYYDASIKAFQAWENALKALREVWQSAFEDEFPARQGFSAKEHFHLASRAMQERLRGPERTNILKKLDIPDDGDVAANLLQSAYLDDLSPNQIKSAFYEVARKISQSGPITVPLRDFLRQVLDSLFPATGNVRRPNVGDNRHSERLFQYLGEVRDETYWSDKERGFHLKNKSLRGPLSPTLRDPSRYVLTLNPDFL